MGTEVSSKQGYDIRHLERLASVDVRQSTAQAKNPQRGATKLQYGLNERAIVALAGK